MTWGTFPLSLPESAFDVFADVALAAVLVPVLVMVLSTLILTVVCAWHWRSRSVRS